MSDDEEDAPEVRETDVPRATSELARRVLAGMGEVEHDEYEEESEWEGFWSEDPD